MMQIQLFERYLKLKGKWFLILSKIMKLDFWYYFYFFVWFMKSLTILDVSIINKNKTFYEIKRRKK